MVKNKSAQLKIQQMAFMLLAVTLFFVLIGMLLLTIKFSGLKKSATELEQQNALLLVSKLANSPEFSCGDAYGNIETNCVDADKAMIIMKNKRDYEGFWGDTAGIEIRKILPSGNTLCTTSNYPNCEIIKISQSDEGNYISNFVSLCRKEKYEGDIYNKCELAKLMVSYKEK